MVLSVLLIAAGVSEEARKAITCLMRAVLSVVMLAGCTGHQTNGYLHQQFCDVVVARRCLFQTRVLLESYTKLF